MQTVCSARDGPSRWFSGCVYSVIFIPTTWFYFGPVFGFHHVIMFGVTGYLFLDDDSPPSYVTHLGNVGVVFHPSRFAISLVLWMLTIAVFRWLWKVVGIRRITKNKTISENGRKGVSL